jgi:hypothetical protein
VSIEAFECCTHLANHRILHLIQGSGLRYESRYSRGVRQFRVWLSTGWTDNHATWLPATQSGQAT